MLSVINKQGHNPLHTAVILGNLFVVRVFLKCGAVVDSSTNEPIKKNTINRENAFIRRNPIHLAAMNNRVSLDIVELLIESRANVEAIDSFGFTPFLWALKTKQAGKSELFLGRVAPIEYRSGIKWEHSPLHLISKWANCPIHFIQKLVDQYKDNIRSAETPQVD